MNAHCKKISHLLDRYHDRELSPKELSFVSEHLEECEACSKELERLEKVGGMLKSHYEALGDSVDLSRVRSRISDAIEATPPEPEPRRSGFAKIFSLPKPVWATIGAVAAAAVLLLSYLPGRNEVALAANDCIIDKVEATDCDVMVYETGKSKMKIIWVMSEQNEGTEHNKGVTS